MKYYSANVSIVTVRRRDGFWATKRQSNFLSGKLCWLFGFGLYLRPCGESCDQSHQVNLCFYNEEKSLIAHFLMGDREADVQLRRQLTPAQYRIVSEVASFLAIDDEGSNAPDAYLAVDLNTGRNLVLRPR